MSKTTSASIPVGTFSISGGPSATSDNGRSNYKLNKAQQDAYDFAQNSFAENLPSINVFSPETVGEINKQVEAYKNNALQELEDIYTPMLTQTRNDAARRFGNLDNSVFLQNLDTVENKRAKAVNNLAQDVVSKQNELVADELKKRYNYLTFLNNYQNQIFDNAINAINSANNSAKTYGQSTPTAGLGFNDLSKVFAQAAQIAGLFV